MRIALIGGTRFIGRAIVEELAPLGHELLVFHRGAQEPQGFPDCEHVHGERKDIVSLADRFAAFAPEAIIDTSCGTRAGARLALEALPFDVPRVVLSSIDVYRAYGALMEGRETDPVPIDETSPVRETRFPYRGKMPGADDYEKLDVEEEYLGRGGTVCRLPMVYGERDYQRREWFTLRRARAGRPRIPVGAGTWLSSRVYVRDAAAGVRLALGSAAAAGEIFNLTERRTLSVTAWMGQILAAAGHEAELVRVPDQSLPPDLELTADQAQHMLVDASKARSALGWSDGDAVAALRRSVEWHLADPPEDDADFSADDAALAAAG